MFETGHQELDNKYNELKNKVYQNINDNFSNEYKKRLDYELICFKKCDLGVIDYLLAIIKIIDYAKESNIYIKSFGSTSSSLTMYMLGISDIDPIKYDLPFERFLNIDRKKSIQIDLYVEISRVKDITDYIKNNFDYNDIIRFSICVLPSNLITKLCKIKKDIDVSKINLNDKEIYDNLCNDIDVLSKREIKILKELKPKCFDELYIINSITYENFKRLDSKKLSIDNDKLNKILKETKGSILYEEQLMTILNEIIGYSLNEADNFRLFIERNIDNKEELLKEKDNFVNIAIKNKCNKELAESIYNMIINNSIKHLQLKSLDLSIMILKYQILYLSIKERKYVI